MLNKVIIIGKVVEIFGTKMLPTGNKLFEFSIACKRSYKTNNELKEEIYIFEVKAFKDLAETYQSKITKGMLVFIEGRLNQERWTTQNNKQAPKVNIVADDIFILSNFDETNEQTQQLSSEEKQDDSNKKITNNKQTNTNEEILQEQQSVDTGKQNLSNQTTVDKKPTKTYEEMLQEIVEEDEEVPF